MNNRSIIIALATSLFVANGALALTETVNGITWTYTVSNSKASVGSGNYYGNRAVPTATSGAITIPTTLGGYPVTSIGSYAFYNCSGLMSVTIPDSVTSIGNWAFSGCSGLTSVTIPDSVTSIEDGAFNGCSGLMSVTIPDSVTSIGNWAFSGCSGLTSVTIPDSVTSIEDGAFNGCSGLTSVTIPDFVTNIGSSAFSGCSGLMSVTIPDSVTSIGEAAFNGCRGLTSVTIPDSVTSIGGSAFYGCSGLTSMIIPDSVTSIGNWAFEGCSGLTSVTIPDSVTSIEESAFYGCSGLTSVTIPDSVTSIGGGAFCRCSGLTSVTIPDSVTSIGRSAFSGCSGLTSVTIPDSVTNIGESAFSSCSGLTSFVVGVNNSKYSSANGLLLSKDGSFLFFGVNGDVTIPDSVTSIGWDAFYNRTNLTSVTIGNSVTNIGRDAFYGCSGLTSFVVGVNNSKYSSANGLLLSKDGSFLFFGVNGNVTIPDSVTSIGDNAFQGCSGLISVTIPASVTSIGNGAFMYCRSLLSVTIPDSVTSIEGGTFEGCSGLTSVTIPDSVTSIGLVAFYNCSGLTSVTIPDSVTHIGSGAFSGCSGLTSVTIPDSVTSIEDGAFNGCSGLTSVTIPDFVTSIEERAFYGCRGLTSVTIPDSVTNIGDYAFSGCSGLSSVMIPASVTSIGRNAFSGCSGLTYVTIPDSVTNIGDYAFSGCSRLTDIYLPEILIGKIDNLGLPVSCAVHFSADTHWYYVIEGNETIIVTGTDSTQRSMVIPSTLGGCPVTSIGEWAFWEWTGLTNVTFPNGLREIGQCAFRHCHGLSSVSIPSSVTNMDFAFSDCGGLLEVNVDESNEVYRSINGVVYDKSGKTLLYFPTGRQGSYAIPDGVTTIDVASFECCALSSIVVGNDVREIGMGAFEWSFNLEHVFIPDSVETIEEWVFNDCENLSLLRLPRRFEGNTADMGIPEGCKVIFGGTVFYGEVSVPRGMPVLLVSGDSAPWFIVADTTTEDGYCIRSGEIAAGETSSVEATLTGPGTLSFKWKVPAGRGDHTKAYLDDVEQVSINRKTTWQTASLNIPAGEHTVRWSYERGSGSASGEDATFLDDVNWRPQVSLSVASAFGTASPATGTHTLVYGEEVTAVATAPEATEGTRHVCAGWTGTGSAPASGTEASVSFTITNDSSIVWNWRPEHWTQVSVSGGSADFEAQWIVAGETVEIPLAPATHLYEIALSGDTDGVTLDGTTLRFTTDRPRQIAVTITEVKVSLMVESAHGFPSPTNGVHALSWGAEVAAGMAEPEPAGGVLFRCTGWTGTGDVPAGGEGTNCTFTIEGDSSIKWNWQTNVWISLALSGPATTDFTNQWVLLGGSVVASFSVSAFQYAFALSGDTDGVVFDDTNLTLSIPADKPRYLSLAVSGLTLAGALDTPGLSWTTDGSAAWFPQYAVSYDGTHAVRSGEVLGDDYCGLETTLSGSGTLSWFWRLDSGSGGNSGVDVLLDGVWLSAYEPTGEWTEESLEIGDGEHTIRFEFWNAGTEATISDCAYIDQVSWTPSAIVGAIPPLQGDFPQAVTNAVDSAGFADAAAVMDAIGGDAEKYVAFKEWANAVKDSEGNLAGEAAVVDSPHAAVSWLLGAEALFENEPEIRIASLALANAQGTGNGEQGTAVAMTVTIEVKDGEDIVKVAEEKVAAMFEATSNLRDWTGAAKLSPTVSGATRNADNTMTFTVIPGDGTAKSAFMRVKVK